MIAMFHATLDDSALLVTEAGTTVAVPMEILTTAGLRQLRVGQRLVLAFDARGDVESVQLP